MQYFYDEQFRRFILQFIRIFSDIKIQVTPGVLRRVPIKYGDMSRMVAMIMRENSQNTVMSAPQLAAWINSVEMDSARRQDPSYVRRVRAVEREYNPDVDAYTTASGDRYSVESFMPVPYVLNMQLDIWTTNTTDKFQIIEQIATVFNPSVQLQSNDNPLDWTSIFEVELTGITWTNRSIPAGTDSVNDIASMNFKLPVWITPPSRVTRQRVIETIITNLYDGSVDRAELRGTLDYLNTCFDRIKEFVVTPANLGIEVVAESSTRSRIISSDPSVTWESLFPLTGNVDINGGILRLNPTDDVERLEDNIVGRVTVDGSDLIFEPDADSLPPVLFNISAIVDPVKLWPGRELPLPQAGQRYLLIDTSARGRPDLDLIPETPGGPWGDAQGREFDIIEYNGNSWSVIFDSRAQTSEVFVRNLDDGQHYRFGRDGWSATYLGKYTPGYWSLEV